MPGWEGSKKKRPKGKTGRDNPKKPVTVAGVSPAMTYADADAVTL
jgi:hypothetical protein